MSKLPEPYAVVAGKALYTGNQLKHTFEAGRVSMFEEVLKVAPESLQVLLKVLEDKK